MIDMRFLQGNAVLFIWKGVVLTMGEACALRRYVIPSVLTLSGKCGSVLLFEHVAHRFDSFEHGNIARFIGGFYLFSIFVTPFCSALVLTFSIFDNLLCLKQGWIRPSRWFVMKKVRWTASTRK